MYHHKFHAIFPMVTLELSFIAQLAVVVQILIRTFVGLVLDR